MKSNTQVLLGIILYTKLSTAKIY